MSGEQTRRRLVGAVSAAVLVTALIPARAQQAGAPPPPAITVAAPQAPAGRGGGGLNDACGGRSANPREACPNDVTRMIATLGLLPDKPPATPQKPRKVLIWSRLPSAGFQHSSIPLAAKTIEEMGKKTGAWTSTTSWDVNDINEENLKQYDAIFLSNTTGTFLDDPNDQAVTDARRKAFQDFLMSGKGVAGIHATGDSYHGGRRGAGRGAGAAPAAAAAPGAAAPAQAPAGATGQPRHQPEAAGGRRCRVRYPKRKSRSVRPSRCGRGGTKPSAATSSSIGTIRRRSPVKIDDPKSPLTAAFRGKSFNTIDEVYTFNESSFSRERVRVLTSIDYSLMSDCDKGIEAAPAQGPRLRPELDSESRPGSRLLPGVGPPRVDLLQQPGHAGAHPRGHAVRARRLEGGRQSEQEEVDRSTIPTAVAPRAWHLRARGCDCGRAHVPRPFIAILGASVTFPPSQTIRRSSSRCETLRAPGPRQHTSPPHHPPR